VDEVYAHSGHTEEFNLGYALQDLHENVVGWFSSEAKTALIAEHLAQVQVKAEAGNDSSANTHRVDMLSDRLEIGVKPSVTQLTTEVILSGELTKLNNLHEDFLDYRTTWFNDFEMPDYANLKNFESEINHLGLAEKYCQNIVADTLIKAKNPYTSYLVDRCPALDDVSPELVMSVFDGANSDE
jgi:hypothetical protein